MKRIAIILIIAFVRVGGINFESFNNACFIMIFSCIFMWGQSLHSPFITKELNNLEFYSSIAILITLFGGIFSFVCHDLQIQTIIMIIVFIINLSFIIYFLRQYLFLKIMTDSNLKSIAKLLVKSKACNILLYFKLITLHSF